MMMKKAANRHENSLMTKMFLYYLILILIPFIFFSALFVNILSQNKRQITIEHNKRVIGNARTAFDEKILSVQNLLFQLAMTKDVINSMNVSYNNTPLDIYTESKCMNIFNAALTANPICDEIFLYVSNNKSILTSTYKLRENNINNNSLISINKIKLLLSVFEQQSQDLGLSYLYSEGNSEITRLLISLSIRNSCGNNISLGAIISCEELSNILEYSKSTSGTEAAIINNKGKLLGFSKGFLSNKSSYSDIFRDASDDGIVKLSNGTIFTYVPSKILPIKLVSLIPAKSLSVISRNVILLLIVMFLLLVLDCIFLNYNIAKHIYKPVTAVLKLVGNSNNNIMNTKNDMNIIGSTLKTSMEKVTILESYMSNNLSHFREKFLLELITDLSLDTSTISYQITALKLHIPYEWYSIHIFHIYNYALYKSIHGKKQAWYARDRLLEILKSFEVPGAVFLHVFNSNKIIVLSNISDNLEAQKFEDLCCQEYIDVITDFYNEFGLECCASIGKYVKKITDVSQSYISALDTLKKLFISNEKNIILHSYKDNIRENVAYSYQYSFHHEDFIMDMLICGKTNQAIERMHTIIKTNFNYNTNYEYIELLFTQLLTTAVRALYESGYTLSDVYGCEHDIFGNFKLYDKTDDIIGFIEREYLNIGTFMQSHIKESTINSYNLEKYISENYTRNIGLTDAAEYFGLSAPYFSKLFKNTMNCLFVDYLCGYRVRKALKLMCDSSKTLKEIAGDVGFMNYKTFARSFFKITSMTPEQYRSREH